MKLSFNTVAKTKKIDLLQRGWVFTDHKHFQHLVSVVTKARNDS